jgi:hypothetical protein
MKKFRKKYQDLSSKAAQFKQALDSAPGRVAELRQMLTETVSDFQGMKDEFRIGSAAFPEVIEQISSHAEVLDETGYSLTRIDMDVGVNPKLTIHLDRDEETGVRTLEDLQRKHGDNVALRSLFSALIKAETMAAKVDLPGMTYEELAVEIGMMPCVRLSWWMEGAVEPESVPPPLPAPVPTPTVAPAPQPASAATSQPSSFFGQGSFFERRSSLEQSPSSSPPAAVASSEHELEHPAEPLHPPKPAPGKVSHASNWQKSALDRFKKMPDLTK